MKSAKSTDLLGMKLEAHTYASLVGHVFDCLERGEGGSVLTANLDILRRHYKDAVARRIYEDATVTVADGMPLVWAARLSRQALPERVAGSTLVWHLAAEAAQKGVPLVLLGGDAGAAEGAAAVLRTRYPNLRVVVAGAPVVAMPPTRSEVDAIADGLAHVSAPALLLAAFGSPKQEALIARLRERFPHWWMVGVGISFGFVAGQVARAPEWMQRAGLEWVNRMAQDPKRLVRRYLIDDLPFAAVLFADALRQRR